MLKQLRRQWFYAAFTTALLGCLWLLSCSSPPPLFRVGSNTWLGYETLYLARDLGKYEGTPLRFIEMANASEVLQAFRNGVLEAAALTLDEALTVVQDGYDVRVVLVMDFSAGADVVLARPPIDTPQGLKGQRIGVENIAVGAIMLDAVLHQAQLQARDVTLVPMPIDAHEQAYLSGKVDAVVTFEPVRSRLLAQGAQRIFDSRQIPGRIVDVLLVANRALQKPHVATLQKLVHGYFAALDYLQQKPQEAAQYMSKRLKLTPSQVLQALQGIHLGTLADNQRLLGKPPALLDSANRLQTLMLEHDMLYRQSNLDHLFSSHALPPLP